ncbi:MAG TPA: alpha,alpha-trehalase TreF [Candidatus Saccharimonadales bacterium]|nr:alpha,alpha-trehalase TreF [Candidatus Saccharimonadales bacterium]
MRKLQENLAKVRSRLLLSKKSPDELLGELFQDVQLRRIFPDSITFVDAVPSKQMGRILAIYKKQRHDPDFDLHAFVKTYFKEYFESPNDYKVNANHTIEQHINELWSALTQTTYKTEGSILALPKPYIVPGSRFKTQFYWDSYFIMIGLATAQKWNQIEDILKNITYMQRRFNIIPTGNRTYYLSRTQPPYLALMVKLLANKKGKTVLLKYLPALIAEHNFWMKGSRKLKSQKAYRRVVKMPDGEILNRYYDDRSTPRPESYKEDVDTAALAGDRVPSQVYLDLRAAAESGWDFSSRWMSDGVNLQTTITTNIVPVDLNSLLCILESTIAEAYEILKQTGLAESYRNKARARAEALNKYCWNSNLGFYFDYNFVLKKQSKSQTIAGIYPLFAQIASKEQANQVAKVVKTDFLKPGGVVTTLQTTGQQWDSPNGWPPHQWTVVQALKNYDQNKLATEIKKRWLDTVEGSYKRELKLVEKYNVIDPTMTAGGGEYVLQDGFGWTNGVYLALKHDDALNWK